MIIDSLLEFCDAEALTAGTGRQLVGDVIDLGATPQDLGDGETLYLVLQPATVISGSSSTISFELASDAAAAIATNGTATVHVLTPAIAEATLVAGYTRVFALPSGQNNEYERYLGIIANVGVATVTGAINAFLTKDVSRIKMYPDGAN